MAVAAWQHTTCGYIHSDPLECSKCKSRVEYLNETASWCPFCKVRLEGMRASAKSKGCGRGDVSKDRVRYVIV